MASRRTASRVALAGLERIGAVVAVAVGEVEQPARDQQRGAVGRHAAEAHGHQRARPVGRQLQLQLGEAQDLERLGERREVERERALVLGALVARPVALAAVGAPGAGVGAGRLDAAVLEREVGLELPLLGCARSAAARPSRSPSARGARRGGWRAPRCPASRRAARARARSRCRSPSASGPTSACTPAGSRSPARARRPAGRRATTGRSGPCAARAGPRPGAARRWSSRPPSRPPRTPAPRSPRSPRRPRPGARSRRGAGG